MNKTPVANVSTAEPIGRGIHGYSGLDHLGADRRLHRQQVVHNEGAGCALDIVLGIVGAFFGGIIFSALGGVGVTGFNLWSLFVATIGAVVILVVYHALFDRRN